MSVKSAAGYWDSLLLKLSKAAHADCSAAPNTNALPGLFSFPFFKWIEAIYCFPYVNFNSKSRLNIITADSFIFKASSCGKRLQWFLLYLTCQQCQIGLFLPCWVSCCKTVVARFLLFVPKVSQVSTHRHIFCSSITVRCLRSTMNPKICSCHWISHLMTVIFLLASYWSHTHCWRTASFTC